ncbi:MAG: ComF family protein [bacterium]|nr:ComF family protein [bacterium]
MGILDFFFPKYCVNCKKLGSYLCSDCFTFITFNTFETCLVCVRPTLDGLTHPGCRGRYTIDGAFASIAYKGVVKKLLYAFKYKPYLLDLKIVLTDLFFEGLIQKAEFDRAYRSPPAGGPVLVPIPLHPAKLKKRGYNQTEILAFELSKRLNLQVKSLLVRTKNTRSQVGLKQKERRENVREAFSISSDNPFSKHATIFLIDDILTTGSTLLSAARTLKRGGAKRVFGLALAIDH